MGMRNSHIWVRKRERSRSIQNRGPRLEKNVEVDTVEITMRVNVCPALLGFTVICIGDLL
jgi:hypothetical protein